MKREIIPDMCTYDNLSFFVDEEKRIVVCKLEVDQYVVCRRIHKYTNNIIIANRANYRIPGIFYGKAKCAPEDTFDVEVGKKIALDRAKKKRRVAINKVLNQFIQDLHDDLNNIEKYCFSKDTTTSEE